jgi:hypothetical protein
MFVKLCKNFTASRDGVQSRSPTIQKKVRPPKTGGSIFFFPRVFDRIYKPPYRLHNNQICSELLCLDFGPSPFQQFLKTIFKKWIQIQPKFRHQNGLKMHRIIANVHPHSNHHHPSSESIWNKENKNHPKANILREDKKVIHITQHHEHHTSPLSLPLWQ